MFIHMLGGGAVRGRAIVVGDPGGGGGSSDGGFVDQPVATTTASGNTTIKGKVKPGSFGKFVYPLATIAAGRQYTFRYTPQFSQLAQQGKLAMVGFGLKNSNDFHIVGLRGDGSTGLNKYKVYGTPPNGWNAQTGHTTSDGGASTNGTQAGPNWIRLVISADGATYKFQTSADGSTWADEYTGATPSPFSNVSGVATFGIALWFNNADAGPFSITIDQFADAAVPDPAGVTLADHGETVNDDTPNYTGLNFGVAASDRVMLAVEAYSSTSSGSSDFTGSTIGGVTATELTEAAASGSVNLALYAASVPTGTSGNIDITISSALATTDTAVSLLRMKGFSATPYAVNQGLTGGTSISRTIDCPAGGVVVAGVYTDGVTGIDWTNVDELDDFLYNSGQRGVSSAARVYASAQTGLSITAAKTGGGSAVSLYLVVASFAPL
ncbi:hypothetical protein [Mesorhizobium sp.]|uniref:hypothetical protein n=1 Tax=Mesorhizobium sp. TaxID=1871066 RepID=UPI000FE55D6C|nr:hypothetical protein [Mesorhizobium sp.]RWE30749.1 MAG: hypothetical protein EOS77_18910 [Mesorhizobium sp.]